MNEKRSEPRFNVSLDVRSQGCGTHYNLRIADISEGGCYVDSILEVHKGDSLSLRILMPEGEWLDVQGVVAHHSPRLGFGVRFIDLDREQRRQIGLLIRQPKQVLDRTHESFLPLEQDPETPFSLGQIDLSCHQIM